MNVLKSVVQETNEKREQREQQKQNAISNAFQALIDKPNTTAKSVTEDGNFDLEIKFYNSSPQSNLLKRIKSLLWPAEVAFLEEDDIRLNPKFQEYKNIIEHQGFDIEIENLKSSNPDLHDGSLGFMVSTSVLVAGFTSAAFALQNPQFSSLGSTLVVVLGFTAGCASIAPTVCLPREIHMDLASCSLKVIPKQKNEPPTKTPNLRVVSP